MFVLTFKFLFSSFENWETKTETYYNVRWAQSFFYLSKVFEFELEDGRLNIWPGRSPWGLPGSRRTACCPRSWRHCSLFVYTPRYSWPAAPPPAGYMQACRFPWVFPSLKLWHSYPRTYPLEKHTTVVDFLRDRCRFAVSLGLIATRTPTVATTRLTKYHLWQALSTSASLLVNCTHYNKRS